MIVVSTIETMVVYGYELKPWYPDGTLSHSWWINGYFPSHMEMIGFDPSIAIHDCDI